MPDVRDMQDSHLTVAGKLLASAWGVLVQDMQQQPDREVVLQSFKVRLPRSMHGEWLIVLTGNASDGTPMVAFMGGDDFPKAFRRAMAQYEDETLRWKIDDWRLKSAETSD